MIESVSKKEKGKKRRDQRDGRGAAGRSERSCLYCIDVVSAISFCSLSVPFSQLVFFQPLFEPPQAKLLVIYYSARFHAHS